MWLTGYLEAAKLEDGSLTTDQVDVIEQRLIGLLTSEKSNSDSNLKVIPRDFIPELGKKLTIKDLGKELGKDFRPQAFQED